MRKVEGRAQQVHRSVPLFGNWRNAYLTVGAFFVVDVALFYFFSRYFS